MDELPVRSEPAPASDKVDLSISEPAAQAGVLHRRKRTLSK